MCPSPAHAAGALHQGLMIEHSGAPCLLSASTASLDDFHDEELGCGTAARITTISSLGVLCSSQTPLFLVCGCYTNSDVDAFISFDAPVD
jgi:hypothetical protein